MAETVAAERAVVIFGRSSCCLCHAVKTLLTELGVSWTVHELDSDPRGKEVEGALAGMVGGRSPPVPAVFIGGSLVGPIDRVMVLHLARELVPLLREAGALWL